eukprot:4184803-Prymnesium_polylepis.1
MFGGRGTRHGREDTGAARARGLRCACKQRSATSQMLRLATPQRRSWKRCFEETGCVSVRLGGGCVSPASNVIGLSSACLRAQAALRVFVLVALLALSVDAFGGASKAAPKTAAKKVAKKAPVKKVAAKKPAKAVVKRGGFSPETDIGVTPPL